MKKTRIEKGITLIALIITIVVLLILAVVAIRAVQGNGIIAHAQNAATAYNKTQTEEKEMLDSYLGEIEANLPKTVMTVTEAVEAGLKVGDYIKRLSYNIY